MAMKTCLPPGIVAGIGRVAGIECVIVANDATVKGGSYYPLTVKSTCARRPSPRRTTCPASIWSIPAAPTCRVRMRCSRTASISAASSTTRPTCRRKGIPQIAVVMGSCTAGGAYVPAMADESIIVKNQGTIFLAGPPLVKAATGEIVTAEELGGAECALRTSGVTDHLRQNDEHALPWRRAAISRLNRVKPERWMRRRCDPRV
jgi:3-methylcrotonyl-CoA carboxylase beta subunit